MDLGSRTFHRAKFELVLGLKKNQQALKPSSGWARPLMWEGNKLDRPWDLGYNRIRKKR